MLKSRQLIGHPVPARESQEQQLVETYRLILDLQRRLMGRYRETLESGRIQEALQITPFSGVRLASSPDLLKAVEDGYLLSKPLGDVMEFQITEKGFRIIGIEHTRADFIMGWRRVALLTDWDDEA